jgi:hypothetical protein
VYLCWWFHSCEYPFGLHRELLMLMLCLGFAFSWSKGVGGCSCEITKDTCPQCTLHQGTNFPTVCKQGSGQEKCMALWILRWRNEISQSLNTIGAQFFRDLTPRNTPSFFETESKILSIRERQKQRGKTHLHSHRLNKKRKINPNRIKLRETYLERDWRNHGQRKTDHEELHYSLY